MFVYKLVDPRESIPFKDSTPFYVGITVNLYERFKQHMRCDDVNPQKDAKIQEIVRAGFLPIMEPIEQVEPLEQALKRERYWIEHYSRSGVKLLNIIVPVASKPSGMARPSRIVRQEDESPVYVKQGHDGMGRNRKYEDIRDIVLFRYIMERPYPGLSKDMQDRYEFQYFIRPKRSEKTKSPRKYEQHVKAYERGRKWIIQYQIEQSYQNAGKPICSICGNDLGRWSRQLIKTGQYVCGYCYDKLPMSMLATGNTCITEKQGDS